MVLSSAYAMSGTHAAAGLCKVRYSHRDVVMMLRQMQYSCYRMSGVAPTAFPVLMLRHVQY
eukprot:3531466-Rhodomonas_salina.2